MNRAAGRTVRVGASLEEMFGVPTPPRRRAGPLDMLIATLLSQNTSDRNSHRAYLRLREAYPSWSSVLAAPVRSIAAAIRIGGMANQKSRRIKALLDTLRRRYGSISLRGLKKHSDDEVLTMLTEFDGIGLKTAACVLLFSLGRNIFPVDTHVHRICSRLGLVPPTNSPERTFVLMRPLIPAGKAYSLHINLIVFGRTICRSAHPRCGACPLYRGCRYEDKRQRREATREAPNPERHRFMLLDHV